MEGVVMAAVPIEEIVRRAPTLTDEECDLVRSLMPPPERRAVNRHRKTRVAS